MQRRQKHTLGAIVTAAWLMLSVGCSGANTNPTNRNLGTRDAGADAGEEPEADGAALDDATAEDAASEDAALTDAAGIDMDAAAADASAAPDATQPGLDAQVELDATIVGEAQVDATSVEDASAAEGAVDASTTDATTQPVQPGATPATGYLKPADSPFASVDFAWFYLEDFEDHQLNTLGLLSISAPGSTTSAGVLSSSFGGGLVDSVDADDGKPTDMTCMKTDGYCDAWWGPGALTFSFDVAALGALPTHVGAVWTDGEGQVSFEAFGPDGTSIYKFGPVSEPGVFPDSTVASSTGEDRFFGAYHPQGISAFTVSNTAGGVEVDHVQYGRAR